MQFSQKEKEALREFICKSEFIHDSKILNVVCDGKSICMFLENLFVGKNFEIVFQDVTFFGTLNVENWGNDEGISILTLDDDDFYKKIDNRIDGMPFVIEHFSGRKTYIVCDKIQFCYE